MCTLTADLVTALVVGHGVTLLAEVARLVEFELVATAGMLT